MRTNKQRKIGDYVFFSEKDSLDADMIYHGTIVEIEECWGDESSPVYIVAFPDVETTTTVNGDNAFDSFRECAEVELAQAEQFLLGARSMQASNTSVLNYLRDQVKHYEKLCADSAREVRYQEHRIGRLIGNLNGSIAGYKP